MIIVKLNNMKKDLKYFSNSNKIEFELFRKCVYILVEPNKNILDYCYTMDCESCIINPDRAGQAGAGIMSQCKLYKSNNNVLGTKQRKLYQSNNNAIELKTYLRKYKLERILKNEL